MLRRLLYSLLTLLVAPLAVATPRAASGQAGVRGASVEHSTAYTTTALRVREDTSVATGIVATLPRGRAVMVGVCDGGWCAVEAGAVSGYAVERYLSPTRPGGAGTTSGVYVGGEGRGYTNAAGERVRSPTRTPDGRAPAGASAQCRDGTYSFSRSRRGTCSHHGGVARWL